MADYYRIPYEKTLAAGDQLNDEEMLAAAGLGLCMANGNEEMKKRVRVYPASNNEDAVGKSSKNTALRKNKTRRGKENHCFAGRHCIR